MKAKHADKLRRVNEKKKKRLLKRVSGGDREPDFIVPEEARERPKSMTECQPEYAFYLANGKRMASLHHLAEELEGMEDETFKHHVNEEKNDFSSWVAGVHEEHGLAEELKECKDKKEHHRKVMKHVLKDVTNYIG